VSDSSPAVARGFEATTDALRDAYLNAAAAVEATRDPDQAFRRATELREATDSIVGDAAKLRARMAHRIWRAEGMSLAKLAARIGISKARADQLIRAARANDAGGEGNTP
jgi:hypothetical protein